MNLIEASKKYLGGASVLMDWIGSGGYCIPKEDAQRRAYTCLNCQHSGKVVAFTGPVVDTIKLIAEIKSGSNLRVDGEKKLDSCSICLCKINLKVWVPIFHIMAGMESDDLSEFPANCWIVKEAAEINKKT